MQEKDKANKEAAAAAYNKEVSAKKETIEKHKSVIRNREFRRRILRETGIDTSAAPATPLVTGKQEKAAGNTNRGAKITSLQANLLLKLLQNKESARQVVALYLALVSEVREMQEKKQECMCNHSLSVLSKVC